MASIKEIEPLIQDKSSLKIIAAASAEGVVHAAPKGTLHVDEDGNLQYVELFEASKSYRNITASLWFNKKVAVLIIGEDQRAFEITGDVKSILISGRKFEKLYRKLQEEKGFDIAAVVTIVPESVENLQPDNKFREQEQNHFFSSIWIGSPRRRSDRKERKLMNELRFINQGYLGDFC
jgi:hypothetical protein